jgi:uncharacterized protein YndB with AHSA1/START domain
MSSDAQFLQAHMVRIERLLPASPEAVWLVLTDIRCLPLWYGEGRIEPKVGGTVELMGGHVRGTVTQCHPPARFAHSWNVFGPEDELSPYPESWLTFDLERRDRGTLLTVTQVPVLEAFVKLSGMGWHGYLDMVEAAVRGETVEARDVYMKRNAGRYGIDISKLPM